MRRTLALILLLSLLPLAALCQENAQSVITVTFLGDCVLGGEDWLRDKDYSFDSYAEKYGYEYFFERVQSIVAKDDLTVANLECVLMDSKKGKVKKTYNFRGLRDYANILRLSSVEAVSAANNHTNDYGPNGVKVTSSALKRAGVACFGSNDTLQTTYVYEKEGIKIGFVAAYVAFWGADSKTLKKQIDALRQSGCAVVVACMHAGAEYEPNRLPRQQKMARSLLDMGADVVVGHHPHVLQGVEVADGKTVCYSIGNFVFGGNAKVRAPYTALFQFAFSFDGEGRYLGHQLTIHPALTSGALDYNNYQPILAQGEDAAAVMEQIQNDSPAPLAPFVQGQGAVQPFVPAE